MPQRTETLFRYRCGCGRVDVLGIDAGQAVCGGCGTAFALTPAGTILLDADKTEQNLYFDKLYAAGLSHAADEHKPHPSAYADSVSQALQYLACAHPGEDTLDGLGVLDVACGTGWVTAGLMQARRMRNCLFHATDISPEGPDMLLGFTRHGPSTNRLETSVQNAERMRFGKGAFDLVIGSSVLHHFNDYRHFLADCRTTLKPGGKAVFGEPFAIGYGIGAYALKEAQKRLGTTYLAVEAFHAEMNDRVKGTAALKAGLVDKHAFFQAELMDAAREVGFDSIEFTVPNSPAYYRQHFVNILLEERGIFDPRLAGEANEIYQSLFDMFAAPSLRYSLAPFMYVTLGRQ